MSRGFYFIFSILFFISCTKTSNNSEPVIKEPILILPNAPNNLTAKVLTSSKIYLNWNDASSDENGFKVERKSGTSSFTVIYTSGPNITEYIDSGLLSGVRYTYRVCSFKGANNSNYTNEISDSTRNVAPTLTTTQISNITASGAISGGKILENGGSVVIQQGVVWNTSSNPTVALSTKTDNRTDELIKSTNSFVSLIAQLKSNTTYYIRAYAVNSVGISYGNEIIFTTSSGKGIDASCGAKDVHNLNLTYGNISDIDGNNYKTIKIGNQEWMAENLKTSRFRNGVQIKLLNSFTTIIDTSVSFWPYYDSVKYSCPYGKVYTQAVAKDIRNACPVGWHVPSFSEWDTLINYLGGYNQTTLKKLNSAGPLYWSNSSDNSSGFSALPGGLRNVLGVFGGLGLGTMFWTSTVGTGSLGVQISFMSDAGTMGVGPITNNNQQAGYIRCVKDK